MTGNRSDERVLEKVASAAREYASEAARLGIVKEEKPCDTKAGRGTEKGHGKHSKVRLSSYSIQAEGGESADAALAAAEAKQSIGPEALTESNKTDRIIAIEKKRLSDPFLVFDENRMEVQDPPEIYTAETLGETHRNINTSTLTWIITGEITLYFLFLPLFLASYIFLRIPY